MTKVLLYCTQPILEAGLRSALTGIPDFQLIESCSDAGLFKERTAICRPDLLMIEVTPAVSLEFLQELPDLFADGPIVLWTNSASTEFLSQALGIGIHGILRKNQSLAAYSECLRSVAAGEIWLDRGLTGALLGRRQVRLSERERQLIGLVAQGLKNKEIARSLGISEGTVKVYLSRLYLKVGANDRFDLALLGLRNVEADSRNAIQRVTAMAADRAVPFSIPSFLSTGHISTVAR